MVWCGVRREMPLADNRGRFQPSHILLLCVFTHGHTHIRTHSAPGLLHLFPVCSEARQCNFEKVSLLCINYIEILQILKWYLIEKHDSQATF